MNSKNTKRSLLTSVLSLAVCGSMLVGTTFAWFTDSVSSVNNVITTGNLDVELYHKAMGAEETDYAKVTEDTNVFNAAALWEPGYVEVVNLKVANEGSLALKYQLGIEVASEVAGTRADGTEFNLSDYIYYAIVEGEKTYASRADAIAAAEAAGGDSVAHTYEGTLKATKTQELTMIVYMPTWVGNEANHKTGTTAPSINFGLNVVATQYTFEEDSFGDDYDRAPSWLGTVPASLEDTTLEIVPGDSAENRGTITINSAEDLVYLPKLAAEWASLYSASGNGDNFTDYKNGEGAAYHYTWQWTVELGADLDMNNVPMDPIALTDWGNFDGNGHTISNVVVDCPETGYAGLFSVTAKAIKNLNVNNVKVLGTEKNDNVGAVVGYCRSSMDNVHVTNATISGNKYVGAVAGKVESGITNSSVTNATVTATGKTVGGLAGYTLGDTTGNTVENVTVSGAYNVGGLLGQAQNKTVENNTVKDVYLTSNALVPATGDATEVRTGAVVARNYNATIGTNTVINVNEALPATPENIQAQIDDAASGTTIYLASAKFHTTINMKSGITLVGTNGTVVDCINLNGASDVTLQNIEFDAAGAQQGYDGKGNAKQVANIISGDSSKNGKGSRNLLIDGCTFTGTFANGGVAIAFQDQSRSSGQSGNITIKNCTFETTGGYVDIYTYYSGYGSLKIEGNTFASELTNYPIYLGRYQSGTPVVVKDNIFEKCASFGEAAYIQDHSDYGVSFAASGNTFGN